MTAVGGHLQINKLQPQTFTNNIRFKRIKQKKKRRT